MSTHPHDFMNEPDPTKQGDWNKRIALSWIYNWGYSTAPIIQLLLGHKGMTWTAEAIKGGWLRKTGATSRERIKVVTLTAKGVAWVEQRRREICRYSELDPHRIAPMTIWHNLLAQRATIYAVRAGKAKSYLTERQDATKSRRSEKKPDAIWITETQERVGVEIELNAKWDQRFDEFVSSTIAALSPSADGAPARFQRFIVLTTSPALASRYASAFEPGRPLRMWRGASKSEAVVERTVKVADWVRERIDFSVVDDNGKELLPSSKS